MTDLDFAVTPQPDETTCGPACLHAVYHYYGDELPAGNVIREVQQLEAGGTLAVMLGLHALRRGYRALIYTCNLQMFDPSWFRPGAPPLRDRLVAQMEARDDAKLTIATEAYLAFLDLGGLVFMEDLDEPLIARHLEQSVPIIAGLSATWLYQAKRELPASSTADDAAGEPVGHFVVIRGSNPSTQRAKIADPYFHKPYPASHLYEVPVSRLIGAILLGIVTYDAKLLVITPDGGPPPVPPCRS